MQGILITIDGPNGVGKSSLVATINKLLTSSGISTRQTQEPTSSPLGQFVRASEREYFGEILTCLVAADRYFHLERDILPALMRGDVVLCDRYVESSLVLQRLDGVDVQFVWEVNKHIRVPDLSVVLTADPSILDRRLKERTYFTRFEETKSRADEVTYYHEAAKFLLEHGFNILQLDNGTTRISENAKLVVDAIRTMLIKRGAESGHSLGLARRSGT